MRVHACMRMPASSLASAQEQAARAAASLQAANEQLNKDLAATRRELRKAHDAITTGGTEFAEAIRQAQVDSSDKRE